MALFEVVGDRRCARFVTVTVERLADLDDLIFELDRRAARTAPWTP